MSVAEGFVIFSRNGMKNDHAHSRWRGVIRQRWNGEDLLLLGGVVFEEILDVLIVVDDAVF